MPIGAVIVEFFSGIADAWRARRALKAQADLQRGADILAQAQREDAEMRAAVEAMEARKRLDSTLSSNPIVPALPTIQPVPPPTVVAQPGAQPSAQPVPVPSPAPADPKPADPKPVAQPAQPAVAPVAAPPAAPMAAVPGVPAAPAAAPVASVSSASSSNVN